MANAMRKVSLRNLAAHKVRLALTLISVVLGTAFISGSFVFTDTLKHTFDKIFATAYQGVDVHVASRSARGVGVPRSAINTLEAVPGVSRVQVDAAGPIVLVKSDGTPLRTGGAPSVGDIWYTQQQSLTKIPTLESGRAPTGQNEIALNASAGKRAHLTAGSHTKLLVPSTGLIDVTVTGIYHVDTDTGGYVGALFPQAQALTLFTDGSHVDAVDLAANPGISQTELRDRIAATLPSDLQAKTGDKVREETKTEIQKALSFVNYFLLAFGFIALIVGTFIIYNTFSMIVAQRVRELALLRAIGADRRQVRRSVLLEAGIIGFLGSVIGVIGGVGLAVVLRSVLDALGTGLPNGPLRVLPRTVVVGLAVGVLVTLISANAPSRRAAKTPPVAAMREEFAALGVSLVRRSWIGAGLLVLGAAAAVLGALAKHAGPAASWVAVALLLVGAGVLLLTPALARTVIGPLGRAVGAPFGAVGRLARTNATRNPRRTAATAFALTLGLLLVAGVAVIGASAKETINAAVDKGVTADYMLTGIDNAPVPPAAAAAARKVIGGGQFVELSAVSTTIDGKNEGGVGAEGSLPAVAPLKIVQGAAQATGTTMLASKQWAKDHGKRVGDRLTMAEPGGSKLTITLGGIFKDTGLFANTWIVSGQVYRELTPVQRRFDFVALVKAAPGTDLAALRKSLEKATDPYYVVNVQNREEFKGQQGQQINGLLGLLYGLLGLAIVIAILGIINTLALSVVERRREIGMLRAVGMVRAQLRRTIYIESLLIAVFGAILGVVLGLTFGALFVHALRTQGLDHLRVPVGQAIAFVVVAAIVGVLAALWPASRAARIRPLEVIAEA